MNDDEPLFSQPHHQQQGWGTWIQIGQTRFHRLERVVNWFYFRFKRLKLSRRNLKHIEISDDFYKPFDYKINIDI